MPLEYEPNDPRYSRSLPAPWIERAARTQLGVAIVMVLLSSVAGEGRLLRVSATLFGITSIAAATAVVIRAKQEKRPAGHVWIWSASIGILFCLRLLMVDGDSSPRRAYQVKCASNMHQIGQSLLAYAQANEGQFPSSLNQLVDGKLPMSAFVCPSTDADPAQGATPAQQAIDITGGNHLSYIYCGKGLRMTSDPDTVVMWEPIGNHHGQGANVLCADGHVDWIPPDVAADLAAGNNPPRSSNSKTVAPPGR